jgi:hypothetical protein
MYRRGQSGRKAIASWIYVLLKNLKFPQFTREVFRRSRSLTGHVHWRLIRRDSEYEWCLQWPKSSTKQGCPSHVHTWCYARVIGDASTVCVRAVSLLELLNQMEISLNNLNRTWMCDESRWKIMPATESF